jgi:intracellular multiplication protein IcmK
MKIRTACFKHIATAFVLFAAFGTAGAPSAFSQSAKTPSEVLAPTPSATVLGAPGAKTTPAENSSPQVAAASAPALAPPGAVAPPSPPKAAAGSALPDGGNAPARSPGLTLPPEAGLAAPTGAAGVPAQKSQSEIKAEIRDDSFNAALTGLLPMEPTEIRKVMKRYDETKEATEIPIYPYPEPENVVKNISLDPGVRPIELKLAVGNVTTVNILDVTGSPWPIMDMTWAGNFQVITPAPGGHIFRITPMSEFAYGNISIRLNGLKTPISFILKAHRDAVYYRVDARMPEYGPYAKPPIIDGGVTLAAGDTSMTAVLDGVVPDDAARLDVTGVDGRTTAYKNNNTIYVRTPLTLLSPAWTGSVKSADGMNVYTLENATVILLSDRGRMVRAKLSERTDKK